MANAMFTRRHYDALASLCYSQLRDADSETRAYYAAFIKTVAQFLARDNSRFDKPRFLRACGLEG